MSLDSTTRKHHGMSQSPEYKIHDSIIQRCYNPNNKGYPDYGGRGIVMCDRWRNSFSNFFADMGNKPEGMSLDRIDTNGNYEPENCRWATPREQALNRRNNIYITYKGETLLAVEWARRLGIRAQRLRKRLEAGWTDAETIETPLNAPYRRHKNTYRGPR